MKKIVTALILTVLICGAQGMSFASEYEKLNNGDFSDGTTDWSVVNADLSTVNQEGTNDYCGKVVMKEAYGRAMHKFKFERNVTYFISVNVRLDRGRDTANLIVDHRSFGDKNMILSVVKGVNVSDKWAKLTGKYVWDGEGTGEAQIYVRVGGALQPITYYIDNLTIEKYSGGDTVNLEEPADGELIKNFGFNNSTEGYIAEGAQISVVSDGVNGTAYGARVQAASSSPFVGQRLYVEPDIQYEVSAYIKAENGSVKADTMVIFPGDNGAAVTGYIRDYSGSQPTARTYLPIGGGTASDEWKLIKGEYTHRGAACELIIGVAPYIQKGGTLLIDNLSVTKKGSASQIENSAGSTDGVVVDGIYYGTAYGFEIKDGYAVSAAEKIAELLGAEYNNGTITKGFNTLELNADDGYAAVNGRLIAAKELYTQAGEIYVDAETVCRAFGAELKINGDTVIIQTKNEINALSNLAESLITDKNANIAFIGGGSAYGRGAGWTNKTSYRALIMKWLRNKFSDCSFNEINRTYWYGDSGFAVYDLEGLIKEQPDVIFVDFAPEDSELTYETVVNNLESIVYKIRKEIPKADIVFLITYSDLLAEAYTEGEEYETVTAYNEVARRNFLTVIDINQHLCDEMKATKQTADDFMTYMWFPNDIGHSFYADTVCDFIDKALDSPAASVVPELIPRIGIIDGKAVEITNHGTFTKNDDFITGNPGDSMEFEFSGNSVGAIWESGIDTGAVEVEIDGVYKGTFYAFNRFGVRGSKTHYVVFDNTLSEGTHTVKITVSNEKAKMSLGNRIKILKFIVGDVLD